MYVKLFSYQRSAGSSLQTLWSCQEVDFPFGLPTDSWKLYGAHEWNGEGPPAWWKVSRSELRTKYVQVEFAGSQVNAEQRVKNVSILYCREVDIKCSKKGNL